MFWQCYPCVTLWACLLKGSRSAVPFAYPSPWSFVTEEKGLPLYSHLPTSLRCNCRSQFIQGCTSQSIPFSCVLFCSCFASRPVKCLPCRSIAEASLAPNALPPPPAASPTGPHARRPPVQTQTSSGLWMYPHFRRVLWRFPLISRTLARFGSLSPSAVPLRASPGPPARPLRLTPRGSWCEEGRGGIREARGKREGSLGTQTTEGSDRGERERLSAPSSSPRLLRIDLSTPMLPAQHM